MRREMISLNCIALAVILATYGSAVGQSTLQLGPNYQKNGNTYIVGPNYNGGMTGYYLIQVLSQIDDASDDNPYLIKLKPGIYDIGNNNGAPLSVKLVMKPYVDIEGSGTNMTRIYGRVYDDPTIEFLVRMARNSEIRSLTLEFDGDGKNIACAISDEYLDISPTSPPRITNVDIRVYGANRAYGMKLQHDTIASDINVILDDLCEANIGIWFSYTYSTPPILDNARVTVKNATDNYGIFINGNETNHYSSYSRIMNSQVNVTNGGSHHYGIYLENASYAYNPSLITEITNCRIESVGNGIHSANNIYGVAPSHIRVLNSQIISGYHALHAENSATDFSNWSIDNTLLIGAIFDNIDNRATYNCRDCFDQNMSDVICP